MTDDDFVNALTTLSSDPYKRVMQTSFDLISYAKEICEVDEELFEAMFQMIFDYQRVSFERVGSAA